MRIALALTILGAMVASSATRSVTPTPVFAFQDAAPPAANHGGTGIGATEIDLVKWGFTQGGLTLVLIVVLVSYRRDFFRKNEGAQREIDAVRDEKRDQVAVLDKCANAMLQQAVATLANTKATEHLAQNVNNLAERRYGDRG